MFCTKFLKKAKRCRETIYRKQETVKESDKERRERLDWLKQYKYIQSKSHNIILKNSDVEHRIGPMVQICSEYQSINFKDKKSSEVDIELFDTYPEFLKELLTDKTNQS